MTTTPHINLLKLSVGTDDVEGLARWQGSSLARGADGLPRHVTRMWPRREAEILAGGSIYWVIRGAIRCRQKIRRLDEVIGEDGIRRCAIVLDPEIVRTGQATRRPFQGWRYLSPEDAPADLSRQRDDEDALPSELSAALAEIGVL